MAKIVNPPMAWPQQQYVGFAALSIVLGHESLANPFFEPGPYFVITNHLELDWDSFFSKRHLNKSKKKQKKTKKINK